MYMSTCTQHNYLVRLPLLSFTIRSSIFLVRILYHESLRINTLQSSHKIPRQQRLQQSSVPLSYRRKPVKRNMLHPKMGEIGRDIRPAVEDW